MQDLFVRVRETLTEQYDIRRLIGTGGMAGVFEAWDPQLSRSVAVKVLKPELAKGVPRERFRREVAVASKLDHKNIVPILTSGEMDGIVYCVMPFVSGESLRHHLIRHQTVPLPKAIQVAIEVAGALEYAHRQGIVHRDVKPENILLSDGHAMVTDFGIARAILDDGSNLTITGTAIGTPKYMSPEQATAHAVDGRTDVYSLGCVLHEMIAGTLPFAHLPTPYARTPEERAKPVSSYSTLDIPKVVDDLVVKALEWKADDRQESAEELGKELLAAQETTGLPPTTGGRSSARGWAVLATAAAGILTAGFAISRLIGPVANDPSLVSIELAAFNGPPAQRELVGSFSDDLIRTLSQSVGIGIMSGTRAAPAASTPDYVVNWTLDIDTTVGAITAHINAELRNPRESDILWILPTMSIPMAPDDLTEASAAMASEIAAAIRVRNRPDH